ncbi:hypothetical protein JHK87_057109 [Glycine soja]|nr:hypothetical protein JHK87_057109 [Glycine soja]
MVKFSKELEAQLIPEWKEAFVNYWQLKKQIKRIKLSRLPKQSHHHAKPDFGLSIFDSLSFFVKNIAQNFSTSDHHDLNIIQVRKKTTKGDEEEIYETELAQLFSEEDEIRVFFMRLDEELNKVNQFYRRQERNFGDSDETNSEISHTDEVITTLERNGISFVNSATRTKTKKGKPKTAMRIDVPATNPTRAITAITSMLWEDLVNNPTGDFLHKRKLQCAEKIIRSAFVELYKGLGLLKTYSSLNMVAFTKILKKFDKAFGLMDEVESIFTKHFANNDRKKAMKFLRPQQHKDSHMVTFLFGLSTGCFVSLFCVYAILAHLCGIFSSSNEPAYMETVYPVFSVFTLLSLHLFMYGCNLFMWKNTRINYNFIFEFSPSTALKHRDAFLISTTLMTTVIGAMVIHLLLRAANFSPTEIDAIPGILLLFFIALLICPFDIFYRPTRYCFIRVICNIVCSPFYKIPLLRHLETAGCHIFARAFKTHHPDTCHSGRVYMEITYIISFLPYYWRALQCARRWFDDGDVNHLANMGKYVSAMMAAGARVTYSRQNDNLWFAIVLITSVVATMYQLYWDFIKDWGFLNPKSINPWLRDDLILKNKSIYYMSIVLNIVLRVTWVETIMHFKVGRAQSRLLEFLLAALEVIRRGHWNFYRLENEHLNNVGHYRAVKTVPLPFREVDSD